MTNYSKTGRQPLVAALLCASVLTGCASGTQPTKDLLKSQLPVLVRCPRPPDVTEGTSEALLQNHITTAKILSACRTQVDTYENFRESLK
jgi:hypothetical protein